MTEKEILEDIKLNQSSKVILQFDNKKKDFPNEETIEGYLEQMENDIEEKHCLYPGFGMTTYDELGEVKTLAYAILSGLTYQFEYTNLTYKLENNNIYIGRIEIKDKIR